VHDPRRLKVGVIVRALLARINTAEVAFGIILRTHRVAGQEAPAQPGDPAKLAKAMVAFAQVPNPPLRLPFGSDTVAAADRKNAAVAKELAEWRSVALSTDFAAA
jgi:hypothetical protein